MGIQDYDQARIDDPAPIAALLGCMALLFLCGLMGGYFLGSIFPDDTCPPITLHTWNMEK